MCTFKAYLLKFPHKQDGNRFLFFLYAECMYVNIWKVIIYIAPVLIKDSGINFR